MGQSASADFKEVEAEAPAPLNAVLVCEDGDEAFFRSFEKANPGLHISRVDRREAMRYGGRMPTSAAFRQAVSKRDFVVCAMPAHASAPASLLLRVGSPKPALVLIYESAEEPSQAVRNSQESIGRAPHLRIERVKSLDHPAASQAVVRWAREKLARELEVPAPEDPFAASKPAAGSDPTDSSVAARVVAARAAARAAAAAAAAAAAPAAPAESA